MSKENFTQEFYSGFGHKIIAIDGPSGGGKSTISQAIAMKIDCPYLETGAMYRAVAYHTLIEHIAVDDIRAIAGIFNNFSYDISLDPRYRRFILNGKDVTAQLRSTEVTQSVSVISAVPLVREKLVTMQRDLIRNRVGDCDRVIVEGRDIGTVVFPDAAIKIYLTASVYSRAQRRAVQDNNQDLAAVIRDVERRDIIDSTREISPLRPAEDAIIVDISDMSLDESIAEIFRIVESEHV